MNIDFSKLTIQFHRLAPGAVLISPNDALAELYPGLGETPHAVADLLVAGIGV